MKKTKIPVFHEPGTKMRFDGNDDEAGAWGFFDVVVVNWNEIVEGFDERGLRVLPKAKVQLVRSGREIVTFTFNLRSA